jgi:hypothetical protein
MGLVRWVLDTMFEAALSALFESFVLVTSASEKGATKHGSLIPSGSRIICATRVAHLPEEMWGMNPIAWDGGRFVDNESEGYDAKTKKVQAMQGFGRGISIVSCVLFFAPTTWEGRQLAAAELKSLLALTLSAFHIALLSLTCTNGDTPRPRTQVSTSQVRLMNQLHRRERMAGLEMDYFQFGG